jgi:hypothetical protein
METVSAYGREFLRFPCLDGWNDIFYYEGRVYQERVERVANRFSKVYIVLINELTNYGLKVQGERFKCAETSYHYAYM